MCLTRDHLKPNVIFFLKYRNKGNKELIQKYAPSSSLAEWRVNSARESMTSFAFKVLFVVHGILLHCLPVPLWRRWSWTNYIGVCQQQLSQVLLRETPFCLDIVIIWNDFLQSCVAKGPPLRGWRVAQAGPLGVSLTRRERQHSKRKRKIRRLWPWQGRNAR